MRIVAGKFKGRRLKSLEGSNTRPTSDKIKGAVFNMIGPYFDGETVLDLYCGSGNLALEALSRGCSQAYCVDHHHQAIKVIKDNVSLLKAEQQVVIMKKKAAIALQEFAQAGNGFDLIFLDPPYMMQKIEEELDFMLANGLIAERGTVVCETDKSVELGENITGLICKKNQLYGNTRITIYQKKAGA
ncbi:16S rRNA (guanine(966)-N(2))-methyltransferase RsmD [Vagococcus elongatus]|uniref:16S rRNA (Guanine(966)-N(2))-methyltransferase RsmD n=1 Tax=Vagococcus elongatus TaxID=180344 RepID=A0A430B235_9ENTE|nr:16S rRNA (guanine(966)-N(2))-methyltransferase RsmD [Vagococcus elongatus]RSU14380.1 16S rRNA (guanine(966)-N(2))-methyltransferase RsmD [Vagococcus elongatus]